MRGGGRGEQLPPAAPGIALGASNSGGSSGGSSGRRVPCGRVRQARLGTPNPCPSDRTVYPDDLCGGHPALARELRQEADPEADAHLKRHGHRALSGGTGGGDIPSPLPKRGDTFTAKQLRKRFGLPHAVHGDPAARKATPFVRRHPHKRDTVRHHPGQRRAQRLR